MLKNSSLEIPYIPSPFSSYNYTDQRTHYTYGRLYTTISLCLLESRKHSNPRDLD